MTPSKLKLKFEQSKRAYKKHQAIEKEIASHFQSIIIPLLEEYKFDDAREVLWDWKSESLQKFNLVKIIRLKEEEYVKQQVEAEIICDCGQEGMENVCPYDEDVNGTETECNCCSVCYHNCTMEI